MPLNNPRGPMGTWPAEHTDELIRLAGEGLSYRAIATALNEKFGTNYNRNCTIGKANRIGLNKEPATTSPRGPRGPNKKPKKEKTKQRRVITFGNSRATRVYTSVQAAEYKLRCVDIVPRNVDLLDLRPNECRYPYNDAGPITFCGHPSIDGSSYCAPHHFLCTEAPRVPIHRFAGVAA